MAVLMVRSKIRAEAVGDVDAAVEHLFAAIHQAQPEGIRYASFRLPDGVTYVALLALDEGVDNPLPALPEFSEFQDNLKNVDGRAANRRAAFGGRVVPPLLTHIGG
jgi:hypothetical protein